MNEENSVNFDEDKRNKLSLTKLYTVFVYLNLISKHFNGSYLSEIVWLIIENHENVGINTVENTEIYPNI